MSKPVRLILAVVAALLTWAVVATIINYGLRAAIAGYRAEEVMLSFSLGSQIARLALGLVATAAAAIAAMVVNRGVMAAPVVAGLLLLAMFVPMHLRIWSHFPVWYHLFFLASLPLVSYGAARWWAGRTPSQGAH